LQLSDISQKFNLGKELAVSLCR